MPLEVDFLQHLLPVPTAEIPAKLTSGINPGNRKVWVVRNELPPSDLYCYLHARFGPPNGMQNYLRKNDSDNLIHWDWLLSTKHGLLSITGMSFRTELMLLSSISIDDSDIEKIVSFIKTDFASVGAKMSLVRKGLEHWTEFVNPFWRVRHAVDSLLKELTELRLEEDEPIADIGLSDNSDYSESWNDQMSRLSRGFGLCFGIRAMLPVVAESYVNLVLYVLMKPAIRSDARLRESKFRQQIDIRIRSLSHDCVGFETDVDFDSEPCKAFHSLMNERNDMLHGNVVIDKLKFNELFFAGTVPIFKNYMTMWDRSVGVHVRTVGLNGVMKEVKIVDDLIDYINSCITPNLRKQVEILASKFDLGIRSDTGKLGILFPDHLVDFAPLYE